MTDNPRSASQFYGFAETNLWEALVEAVRLSDGTIELTSVVMAKEPLLDTAYGFPLEDR